MRESYEVAWMCAKLYAGEIPELEKIDDMDFIRPVEVGTLVRFDAHITVAEVTIL
jgi:acyl-CoA hydrolase